MAAFALALFLTGTHWCLVGGVASLFGARISCMTPAVAGSCHASASSHCGHAAPARSAPARSAAPPCCVALAPVVSTTLVAIPDDALAPAFSAAPATEEAAPASPAWLGYRVTRDTGPPASHARAPLSSRAPPLA
jgi:hypothetical protein